MSKRLCNIHGLWEKSAPKDGCPKCKKVSTQDYDKNYRNKESDTFYHSREWKRVRGLQLSKFPLCVDCKRVAKIVDHIIEIEDGGAKLSLNNLQSMCVSCHNAKTAAHKIQRGGVGKSLEVYPLDTDAYPKLSQKMFHGGTL